MRDQQCIVMKGCGSDAPLRFRQGLSINLPQRQSHLRQADAVEYRLYLLAIDMYSHKTYRMLLIRHR